MYHLCSICSEAYFLTEEARDRHHRICLAVKGIQLAAVPDAAGPSAERKRSQQTPPSTTTSSKRRATPDVVAVPLTSRSSSLPPHSRLPTTHSSTATTFTRPTATKTPSTDSTATSSRTLTTSPASTSRPLSSTPTASATAAISPLHWELRKALSSARDYKIFNSNNAFSDLAPFLGASTEVAANILRDEMAITSSFKYNLVLEALYAHPEGLQEMHNFKTSSKILHSGSADDLTSNLMRDTEKLLREESEAAAKGSGWSLVVPTSLTLRVSRLNYVKPPGRGVVLPKKLKSRKATINVLNTDEKCFMYCVLAKHLPQNVDYDQVTLNERSFDQLVHLYNFRDLDFPLPVSQMKRFERNNPGCSINVFECGPDGLITPHRIAERELEDHTDILLYKNGDGDSHYVFIRDFAKLVRPQIAKGSNSITICKRCFTHKESRNCRPDPKTWLTEHLVFCGKYQPCDVKLPKEGENQLKFHQYETQIPVPIIVLADFEATLYPTASTDRAYQRHEANSFCTLVKSSLAENVLHEVGISTAPHLHRSENAGPQFLLHMKDLAERVERLYTRQMPTNPLTEEELMRFEQANSCDLCERSFNERTYGKILDHCHITGAYRHALCNQCNLRCRTPNFIPVYFHNLSNYDQSFLVKHLDTLSGCEVKAIPSNTEKFISISVKVGRMWIRFLDSYRLMSASLASLVEQLPAEELGESSKLVAADQVHLIKRKGIYPYDYVSSHSVFDEVGLPPRDKFFNRLNDEQVTEEDYRHALNVWRSLEMNTFGDYHDFYLRLDVCQLADVLTSFRKTCLNAYKIDCCHQYTAPGLAFSAMLRMTKVVLELITDSDQMLMIESAIRGGLVQCNLRHAKANNRSLGVDYRPDEETSHLLYLDCVNLYGYAMSMPLPSGDFKWVEDIGRTLDWTTLPVDSPQGYIMECDVEVPVSVHDKLEDLPLMPELATPPGSRSQKLLATLTEKRRYVAHYTVFQQAVRLGLRVTKVHRALRFSQSPWMKKFIDYNATLRARATNDFDRAFYKLQNNATYGKAMENVRNRVDVRIVTTDAAYQKLVRKTRFVEHRIISDSVVAVHMRRGSVLMNKPIYVGMCVLDISKVHMYNFHYNVMQQYFRPSHLQLVYIDTDGLIYHIRSDRDVCETLRPAADDHFDSTVVGTNVGKIGTFKDECKGKAMIEFVGLRAKMYAYRCVSEGDKRKAKGIKSAYVQRHLRFAHYKDVLFGNAVIEPAEFNVIRCKTFHLTSAAVVKKSLCGEDDKRRILDCGLRTLPYGHYRLNTAEDSATNDNDDDDDDDEVA